MSSLNAIPNFASAETSRQTPGQPVRTPDALAAQLQSTGRLAPGTTVTARYQYRVAVDGSLVPTETRITTQSGEAGLAPIRRDGNRRPGGFFQNAEADAQRESFASLSSPRPQLSPTDELALFAITGNASNLLPPTTTTITLTPLLGGAVRGEAVDEEGAALNVEIIPPEGQSVASTNNTNILSLASRAQFSAASLYARNNDIVFNVTPISELAA